MNESNGALSFATAPDFENRKDNDTNNVYEVTVTASDGDLNSTQAFSIKITNVNEAPVIRSNGGGDTANITFPENLTISVTSLDYFDSDSPKPDGRLDVLSASSGGDRIAWYGNDGSGSFGSMQTITNQADGAQSVYAADLDGDGRYRRSLGFFVGRSNAWYENNGNRILRQHANHYDIGERSQQRVCGGLGWG